MSWTEQRTYTRGNSLKPSRLRQMSDNADFLRAAFSSQHNPANGRHNVLEIPRVVKKIVGTTVSPAGGPIVSVTNPSAGVMVIALDSSFTTGMRVMVGLRDHNSKPHLASVSVDSDTQITITAWSLTSALGAGNAWGAFDMTKGLAVAIFDAPVSPGGFASDAPPGFSAGAYLDEELWNSLCDNVEELNSSMAVQHDSATGAHKFNEVAAAFADVFFASPSTYSENDGENIDYITRASAGVVEVGLDTYAQSSFAMFATTHSRSPGASVDAISVAHAWPGGAGGGFANVTVYSYSPSTDTWSAADSGFMLTVHREP